MNLYIKIKLDFGSKMNMLLSQERLCKTAKSYYINVELEFTTIVFIRKKIVCTYRKAY